jgi:hypothetical protein
MTESYRRRKRAGCLKVRSAALSDWWQSPRDQGFINAVISAVTKFWLNRYA